MRAWLQGYAYRIDLEGPLGGWLFVGVSLSMLLLSLAAVAWQALRAGAVSAVEALRLLTETQEIMQALIALEETTEITGGDIDATGAA